MPAEPPAVVPHVGLFDSGIGGLSVLRALVRRLPAARFCYVADTAFTPWGDRPPGWVVARCTQLSQWLIDQGADLVLVACNTGTTQAIAALRAHWPQVPFVGVEPGIKPAVAASRNRRVAVLATTGTLRSHRLRQLLDHHAGDASVLRLPCPGLAEAIERADASDPALLAHLDEIAARLGESGADTVVLGCTHYPLVAEALQQRLGPAVRLIDTAEAVARRVASLLPHAAPAPTPASGAPLQLRATGPAQALERAARRWLGADAAVQPLALPPPGAADPV
ncbi:MAG: glutamate racemase [Burkholderiaceae bacterium]|nr:glutamate racemase [Burkholderiaceae bacterium]